VGHSPEGWRGLPVPIAAEDPVTKPSDTENLSVAAGDHTTGPSDGGGIFLPGYR
jgi:hypothetical protein